MPDRRPRKPRPSEPRGASARRAAALRYPGQDAPAVVASGRGLVAERILAAARDAGVPVRHDPALAEALSALDLGVAVPEELYVAVAEALVWAYEVDRRADAALRRPR